LLIADVAGRNIHPTRGTDGTGPKKVKGKRKKEKGKR
jgi:hypothetical protein